MYKLPYYGEQVPMPSQVPAAQPQVPSVPPQTPTQKPPEDLEYRDTILDQLEETDNFDL